MSMIHQEFVEGLQALMPIREPIEAAIHHARLAAENRESAEADPSRSKMWSDVAAIHSCASQLQLSALSSTRGEGE